MSIGFALAIVALIATNVEVMFLNDTRMWCYSHRARESGEPYRCCVAAASLGTATLSVGTILGYLVRFGTIGPTGCTYGYRLWDRPFCHAIRTSLFLYVLNIGDSCMRKLLFPMIAATLVFTGCGGAEPVLTPGPAPMSTGGGLDNTGLRSVAVMAVPNVGAGTQATPFVYDFGNVDPIAGKYYLADRTNKSVDIFNTSSLSTPIIQVHGFTGIGATFPTSGPNDVTVIPGSPFVYATDVDNVRVINTSTDQITQSIVTSTSGLRSDADCYDSDDKIVMADNGADTPPFAAYISTATNTVTSKLAFATSAGLEACLYDPGTKNFFINNDGTPANPNGELDVIPAASVVAGAPTVSAQYSEGNCGPAGIALGPNEELVIGCDAPAGDPQITLIMNATTGAILKTITQVGPTKSHTMHVTGAFTRLPVIGPRPAFPVRAP